MNTTMTYIILSAGKGVKLQPLTLNHPKSLYKLDDKTTILQRLVRKIRKYDAEAEIVVDGSCQKSGCSSHCCLPYETGQ